MDLMSVNQETGSRPAKQQAARDRCDAMVHHARQQIVEHGLDRFSVNEVLRQSGGSKATLAKYFGGRNGLVAAAIRQEAEHAVAGLDLASGSGLPLEKALLDALLGILQFYCSPDAVALYRAVIASADPEGSAGFYECGHAVIRDALAGIMEGRKGQDVSPATDTGDVADQMLHAVRAGAYEQLLIGISGKAPDDEVLERRVARTVALFLPAIRLVAKD